MGEERVQWIVSLLLTCILARLPANRSGIERKPATVAKVDGPRSPKLATGEGLREGFGQLARAGLQTAGSGEK